jgi:Flp pilus assembly protein TadG
VGALIDRLHRRHPGRRVYGRRTGRRGGAMVEFALILPVLVLLLFALMEYGWMFLRVSQVNGAARHGVRTAVRPDATAADVNASVALIMKQAGYDTTAYTVTITNLAGTVGSNVSVTITLPYSKVSLTHFPVLPVPTELRGAATMGKEGPSNT